MNPSQSFGSSVRGSNRGGYNDNVPEGYELGQIQQFTPEQNRLMKSLYPHLGEGSNLSRLASGDQSFFDEIEAPALRQFAGLQGNLASRFSAGGMGGRHSSGFQNAAGAQASDFALQLQSQRQGLTRQALNDLMGMSNQLLNQRPYERTLSEKPREWWEAPLTGFAQGAGEGVSKALLGG